MDSSRAARLQEILLAAADLSEAERAVFLDEACKDDPELRREVESILAQEGEPTAPARHAGAVSSLDSHPTEIGPFRILERIGEGGMGVVYLAEQTEPVRRRVALKVIKLGMDTKQVVARFEAERQALAMMDHPNIAKVLDGGVTPDGRPYFVMECVRGIPITDYCDRHSLRMAERLELFTHICEAVQHAHQKGVIHRDLKPTNVLVEVVDDHPVPKVIDFGVAKATAQPLTERTVYTEHGQLIGTPAYMSPEQAEMTGLNVDTRTDIYSLGVLLYELLVGALPFERGALRRAGFAEIQRILREVDPPRPSARLSSLGSDTETVAKRRQTDRSSLMGQLRGDLDWITMKALEKDRTRRYASASEFAADIRRFLNDEPVLARPPAATYRMRKYVKRHRVGVGFTAAVGIGIVLAISMMTVQNARIAAARDEAELVTATFEEMLSSVDPWKSGRDVTVREMLDETATTLGERFGDQPFIEARLRRTVGLTFNALGEYSSAENHLRRQVEILRERAGEEDYRTLDAMNDLTGAFIAQGRNEEAEALARETLEVARRVYGQEHPVSLAALSGLAVACLEQGRPDEAGTHFGEAFEFRRRVLGERDPETLTSMFNLAVATLAQGRLDEAEALLLEVLEKRRDVLGEEHPEVLRVQDNLAWLYASRGDLGEAEELYREVLEASRRLLGEEHPGTLNRLYSLAGHYRDRDRHEEAETHYRELLAIQRRVLGEEHRKTLLTLKYLAYPVWSQGRFDEAMALERQALSISERILGERHRDTNGLRYNLACSSALLGRRDEAISFLQGAVDNGFRTACWRNPCPIHPNGWSIHDDSDLAALHGDPEFEAIAEELRRRNEEAEAARVN
jgi:serine/threonine protein kinase/thioredoxin-like negative regulator of GroEL